jgi:hypothetical protein
MTGHREEILESPPSEAQDDFWLEQGRRMVEGALDGARQTARALMTGLGLLQAIYLGILGLGDFVPSTAPAVVKGLYAVPLLIWLVSLCLCLRVMLTDRVVLLLNSPDDIRARTNSLVWRKQRFLEWSYWLLSAGVIVGLIMAVLRPGTA